MEIKETKASLFYKEKNSNTYTNVLKNENFLTIGERSKGKDEIKPRFLGSYKTSHKNEDS